MNGIKAIVMMTVIFSITANAESHSFGGRTDTNPRAPRPAAPPTPGAPGSVPAKFKINDYAPPPPNQMGTGRCLYFASTGIAEWLYGRAKCKKGQVGGAGDFSEKAFFEGNHSVAKPFTEAPMDFARNGYVKDADYKFNGKEGRLPSGLKHNRDMPQFDKKVLFDYNRSVQGDAWAPGGRMTNADVEKIKQALVQYKSPILFMYTPTKIVGGRPQASARYWHANYIVGWNEKGFIVRDSAFGENDTSAPKDPTGKFRLKPTLMAYDFFKASGKSAAVYHLKKDPGCREATPVSAGGSQDLDDVKPMDPTNYPKPDASATSGGNANGVSEYREN